MDHDVAVYETPWVYRGNVLRVSLHTETAGRWIPFFRECWSAAPDYVVRLIGGHYHRAVRGGSRPSAHGMEGAVDINWDTNAFCKSCNNWDLPAEWPRIAARHGIGWGGSWRSVKDYMHFSLRESEGGDYFVRHWDGIYPWRNDPAWRNQHGDKWNERDVQVRDPHAREEEDDMRETALVSADNSALVYLVGVGNCPIPVRYGQNLPDLESRHGKVIEVSETDLKAILKANTPA